MRVIKSCFICGVDNRANTRLGNEEFKRAIDKLKADHPKELLTIRDLAMIDNMEHDGDRSDEKHGMQCMDEENGENIEMMII